LESTKDGLFLVVVTRIPILIRNSERPLDVRPEIRQNLAGAILSERQRSVFRQIREGKCNKDIAKAENISERTVKFHASNLFRLYGVTSRIELRNLVYRKKGRPTHDASIERSD
jgi:DNA-binding NarL/FixJ family response regulator